MQMNARSLRKHPAAINRLTHQQHISDSSNTKTPRATATATTRTTATPRDTATPPPFFCSTPHIFTVARTLAVKTSTTNYTVN